MPSPTPESLIENFIRAAIIAGWRDMPSLVNTEALQPVATAFVENFERALTPCVFVAEALYVVSFRTTLGIAAAGEDFEDLDTASPEVIQAVKGRLDDLLKQDEELSRIEPLESIRFRMEMAHTALKVYFKDQPLLLKGLHLSLASMVVNGWTAFETLCSDLWIVSLDTEPELARNAIRNTREGSKKAESDKPSESLKFVETLIARGEMERAGSSLRHHPQFEFDKYDKVKEAYTRVFGHKAKTLMDNGPFRDMYVLDAVRNVLVHNAGKADRVFLHRAGQNVALFETYGLQSLAMGENINLDGLQVRDLLQRTVDAAKELIGFVDDSLAGR